MNHCYSVTLLQSMDDNVDKQQISHGLIDKDYLPMTNCIKRIEIDEDNKENTDTINPSEIPVNLENNNSGAGAHELINEIKSPTLKLEFYEDISGDEASLPAKVALDQEIGMELIATKSNVLLEWSSVAANVEDKNIGAHEINTFKMEQLHLRDESPSLKLEYYDDISGDEDSLPAAAALDQEAGTNQIAPKSNLMLEWSRCVIRTNQHKPCDTGRTTAATMPPRAYLMKDDYQRKRDAALRQREEEERKMREFHSRPVPNFKLCHKRLQERPVVHRITCPLTPATLKTWRVTQQRRKEKEEDRLRQEEENKQKQLPRSAAYLHEQKPFQPTRLPRAPLEPKPFNLHSDERVVERREYNALVYRTLEDKKKQCTNSGTEVSFQKYQLSNCQ